jgi:flagellar biosynthetic protein FliR
MDALQQWILVFLRAGGFLNVLPIFSGAGVPVQLRVALSAALGLLLAPNLAVAPLEASHLGGFISLCVQELLAGLSLGFVARMVFYAADFAGRLIANETGLGMASLFDPLNQTSTQVPAVFLFWLALMLMLTLDLHHWLLLAFQQSYLVLPPGGGRMNASLLGAVIEHTGGIFVVGLKMAAPMIAVSFIVVLVFAILGRAVPQMNVFSESFALRIVSGLLVFGATLSVLAQHIENYLRRIPDDVVRIAEYLAGGG